MLNRSCSCRQADTQNGATFTEITIQSLYSAVSVYVKLTELAVAKSPRVTAKWDGQFSEGSWPPCHFDRGTPSGTSGEPRHMPPARAVTFIATPVTKLPSNCFVREFSDGACSSRLADPNCCSRVANEGEESWRNLEGAGVAFKTPLSWRTEWWGRGFGPSMGRAFSAGDEDPGMSCDICLACKNTPRPTLMFKNGLDREWTSARRASGYGVNQQSHNQNCQENNGGCLGTLITGVNKLLQLAQFCFAQTLPTPRFFLAACVPCFVSGHVSLTHK